MHTRNCPVCAHGKLRTDGRFGCVESLVYRRCEACGCVWKAHAVNLSRTRVVGNAGGELRSIAFPRAVGDCSTPACTECDGVMDQAKIVGSTSTTVDVSLRCGTHAPSEVTYHLREFTLIDEEDEDDD